MELETKLENTSPISRKLTITVPASEVLRRFESGITEVQKTAKLKGFRPGQVPVNMVKQVYGDDVRHQIYHQVIDESYRAAIRKHELKAVGRPEILMPGEKKTKADHKHHDHDHGHDHSHDHDHDHGHEHDDHSTHQLKETEDLTFTATFDVLPEIEVKGYTGIALKRPKTDVTDKDVEQLVSQILDSHAQLIPASSGLVGADGKSSSRPAKKGDHADIEFTGGTVTDKGVELKDSMKGSRVVEIGSDTLIPGFEDEVVGMRSGETKTFQIKFPADFYDDGLKGAKAEFTVTLKELKEKKLPELDDEFAKGMGYENLADFKSKAKEGLIAEKNSDADRKLRSDLLQHLIDKNKFDVPKSLIVSQANALAQDLAQELAQQRANEETIRALVGQEMENIHKKAENQVRASLILESVADQEKIKISPTEIDEEMKRLSQAMRVEEPKLREYYGKNAARMEDLAFRMRQEKTVKVLLDKAKVAQG